MINQQRFQTLAPYKYFIACLASIFFLGVGEGGFLIIVVGYLEEMSLALALIGATMAFFSLVEGISNLLVGFLYRGINEKKIIRFAVIMQAAGCFLFAFQPTGATIWLAVILNASGLGVITVMVFTTAQLYIPPNSRMGLVVGLYTSSIALGMAVGSPLVGYLTDTFGFPVAFAACSLLILSIILPISTLPNKQHSAQDAVKPSPLFNHLKQSLNFKKLNQPEVLTGMLSAFAMASSITIFHTLFPIYSLRAGLTYTTIGSLMGLKDIAAGVIRPLIGLRIASSSVNTYNSVGLALLTLAIFSVPFTGLGWGLYLAVGVIVLAFGSSRVTSMTLVMEGQQKPSETSQRISLYNAMMTSGHIIGPGIGGILAGWLGISLTISAVPAFMLSLFAAGRWSLRKIKASKIPAEQQESVELAVPRVDP